MSRGNTTAMNDALDGVVSRPAILAKFEFGSGDVFAWSGMGDLSWDSETWQGVGAIVDVELPEERSDGSADGATFTLSGVDSSWISLALTENYQHRPCTLWYAELDGSGAVIADPLLFFSGVMDQMRIQDDGKTSIVRLSVERRSFDNRPANALYDDKEQQRRYPGDKGFEYLPTLQEKVLQWGSPATASGSASNPNTGGAGSSSSGGGGGSTNPRNTNRGGRGRG